MNDPKYQAVVEYLNNNFAYFCVHVLNLGRPNYTNSIPTAAVGVTSSDDNKFLNFEFMFNPDFLDELGPVPVQAFVFAHETMHILLDHLRLAGNFCDFDYIMKHMDAYNAGTLDKDIRARVMVEQKKMQCFNIAADCVINDWLVKEGFEMPPKIWDEAKQEMVNQLMTGQDNVGHDCSAYTVREVYNELMRKFQDQEEAKGEGNSIDSHDWLFKAAKEAIEAAEKLVKELEAAGELPGDIPPNMLSGGKRYSLTAADVAQDFVDTYGVSLEWMKLLKEINPDVFKMLGIGPPQKASFHRHRRKLGAFPDLKLPVKRVDKRVEGETDKVPALVIALDTSGSISQSDRNKFISLARSVPQKKIKLFPITFTTRYKNLDLEHPVYNSGGTCFSCIQDYINKEVTPILGHYPSAVVVVTDGEADFSNGQKPTEKEFKSWFWLLTTRNTKRYINHYTNNQDRLIDEFVKR